MLKDKIALVTSSTRGIGLASALKLAKEGATVYLGVRRMEATQEICDNYKELKLIPVYFNAYEEDSYKAVLSNEEHLEEMLSLVDKSIRTSYHANNYTFIDDGLTDSFILSFIRFTSFSSCSCSGVNGTGFVLCAI